MVRRALCAAAIAGMPGVADAGKCTASDSWHGPDKREHALIGAGVGFVGGMITESPWKGFALGVGAGALKEALDSANKSGTCSLQDFAVTAAGAAVGAGLSWFVLPAPGRGVVVGFNARF